MHGIPNHLITGSCLTLNKSLHLSQQELKALLKKNPYDKEVQSQIDKNRATISACQNLLNLLRGQKPGHFSPKDPFFNWTVVVQMDKLMEAIYQEAKHRYTIESDGAWLDEIVQDSLLLVPA